MTFGRTRSRDRSRGHSSARVPLVLDFRAPVPTFGWAVDTLAPAGCAYTRAASPGTVQSGTSTLYDLSIFSAAANLLVWGRAVDAWDVGLLLEEARTNLVPRGRDFSHASWTKVTTGTPSYGAAVSPFGGATGATLLTVPITTGYLAETSTSGAVTGDVTASWWQFGDPANGNVYTLVSGDRTATTLGSASAWGRLSISRNAGGGASSLVPADGRDWSAKGGLVAAAHTVTVDACQREAGSFPTEYIPTTGTAATRAASFLRVLSATVTPKLNTGRLSIELKFRAKGARTEYGSTTSLWYVDANNQAAFVASTGVLTITVAGATNTCTLPAWARYDLIELSIQCGGGLATVVKYRLNAGAVTSLAITGSALGTHATGDLYLLSTNAGQHLSAWLYTAAFYPSGGPSWAA